MGIVPILNNSAGAPIIYERLTYTQNVITDIQGFG